MSKEAIILAGGLGTRLKGVIKDIPKPMAPINGIPFLKFILDYLIKNNIKNVVLSVGYKHSVIIDEFGYNYKGLKIDYSIEDSPLGTGGAILLALNKIKSENVFIINGDTYFDLNLQLMRDFFNSKKYEILIALKHLENFDRYGTVKLNNDKIIGFKEKQYCESDYINAGIYLLNKKLFLEKKFSGVFSFEKDYMEKFCQKSDFGAFKSDSYFIDIGIPSDYEKCYSDFIKMGLINSPAN